MQKKTLTFLFILLDLITASLAWGFFYYLRKIYIEHEPFQTNPTFFLGIIVVPFIWFAVYFMQGTYHDVGRMYRLKILGLTFFGSLIGTFILFFALLLDDTIVGYQSYYQSLIILFLLYFISTLIVRLLLTNWIVAQIHQRKSGFRTLLIGGSDKAVSIYNEIQQLEKGIGNDFIGFVNLNGIDKLLENELPYLGHADKLEEIIIKSNPEEVIIALESTEHERLSSIISRIDSGNISIKILSDMYDILSGSVKMTNIYGALLMEVNTDTMPIWQKLTKRVLDFVLSLLAIMILLPVYSLLAILVKMSSKGSILYCQDRVGVNGKLFKIIKFRTMFVDSEKNGPQLSSENDPRITPIGRFLRKVRLDEIPQFFNVLIGDMSLVGPRPERQFYIDKISAIEPQFRQLTKVRPGITSWGQVKFGYAENVDQMLQRMKFDLLYLKNRSLALDFKIMLYTVRIVLQGTGK
jgi:exopolysaccharide biosynthesis polyprenyl glycosylphosphotransferase